MTASSSRSVVLSNSTTDPSICRRRLYRLAGHEFPAGNCPSQGRRDGRGAADGQKLGLPDDCPWKDGDAVTVGLRPEHIPANGKAVRSGRVEVVEPLGLSTQFYVSLRGQQACVFVMGRSNVRPGDVVRLSADPAALHLFDPASGDRIG